MATLYIKNSEGVLVSIPSIKGEKGDVPRYEDLTEAQKQELAGYSSGSTSSSNIPTDEEITAIVDEVWNTN